MINMRKFRIALIVAGMMALLTVMGAVLPGRARDSAATPLRHIVVLMQENHSFDSELGFWCDANPGRCPVGGMPAVVRLSDGSVVRPTTAPDMVPSVCHSIACQAAAIDKGKMDGWQKVGGCAARNGYACISGYLPSAIPNLATLASDYAIEDNAFTQVDAPSWGGHLDLLAGTTDGFTGDNPSLVPGATSAGPGWGCDAVNKVARMLPVHGNSLPPQPACVPDFHLGLRNGGAWESTRAKHVSTILDEMDAAGVSWNIYAASTAEAKTPQCVNRSSACGYIWSACPSFADCLDTSQDQHLVESSQFFTDAAAGRLPSVSFVMPAASNLAFAQHNDESNAAGDNWIGKIATAVMNGPDWSSTALIIAYDDCGCFYDQVAPPLAPDGSRMGVRVPFVVVSLYAKQGYTDSTVTSSTGSILAFIEGNFGLPALGPDDAAADNLVGMFNFSQPPRKAVPHMAWRHLPASAYKVTTQTANDDT